LFKWPHWCRWGVLCLGYVWCVYHLIGGDLGLRKRREWIVERQHLTTRVRHLEKKHARLKHHIALMDVALDKDVLEQQVRRVLGYVAPADIVVLEPSTQEGR
jgi:cell division protein FtsB